MASISGLPVLGSGWRPRSCCLCIRLRCNPLSMVNHKNHLFLILTPPSPSHKKHIWWFPKIGLPPVVIPSNNRFFHYKPSSYWGFPHWNPPSMTHMTPWLVDLGWGNFQSDLISCSTLINACERGSQWQQAAWHQVDQSDWFFDKGGLKRHANGFYCVNNAKMSSERNITLEIWQKLELLNRHMWFDQGFRPKERRLGFDLWNCVFFSGHSDLSGPSTIKMTHEN